MLHKIRKNTIWIVVSTCISFILSNNCYFVLIFFEFQNLLCIGPIYWNSLFSWNSPFYPTLPCFIIPGSFITNPGVPFTTIRSALSLPSHTFFIWIFFLSTSIHFFSTFLSLVTAFNTVFQLYSKPIKTFWSYH